MRRKGGNQPEEKKAVLFNQNKFHPDGRPRSFPGNTVICHLPPDGAFFHAMLDLHHQMGQFDFAAKIALLPPSSYHMTVFDGLNNTRRARPTWPRDLARDTPMPQCNAWVGDRLRVFPGRLAAPLRMRPAYPDPLRDRQGCRIRLEAVDRAGATALRRFRHGLAAHLGMHDAWLDRYVFHTTIGYRIRAFTAREAHEYTDAMVRFQGRMAARLPEIDLGPPEFCLFDDMHAYHRQFLVA
ncbi:DUF1868 domain-containing protein [Komagataeibacter sp. AV436]|uniref:DUF1868 domain-containing protein n=1 Tax=Komagataeibacter melomenusus TaxID=2766578 RepID=A0ABX2AI39_9PROT|nr:DUF1868 domain-containing protein [Komagataeibacter melomenusus]NPC67522.1 DUF1868 domain-containing protein [Komagataeibacter melomenusus]